MLRKRHYQPYNPGKGSFRDNSRRSRTDPVPSHSNEEAARVMLPYFTIARPGGVISLPEWRALIESTPYLELAPDYQGANPKTRQPIMVHNESRASFLVDRKAAGVIAWIDGLLRTAEVPEAACAEIALKLGAKVSKTEHKHYTHELLLGL
jgi:hypothetical protein